MNQYTLTQDIFHSAASCQSCNCAHKDKTNRCHDNLSPTALKKKFPDFYKAQEKALEENKKKPLSVVTDIFIKPLKDFEVLKGTPLGNNFKEPFWFNDYWEIFKMKIDTTAGTVDDDCQGDDLGTDDGEIAEKPDDEKQQAVSKWNAVAESLTKQAPSEAASFGEEVELVATSDGKKRRVCESSTTCASTVTFL